MRCDEHRRVARRLRARTLGRMVRRERQSICRCREAPQPYTIRRFTTVTAIGWGVRAFPPPPAAPSSRTMPTRLTERITLNPARSTLVSREMIRTPCPAPTTSCSVNTTPIRAAGFRLIRLDSARLMLTIRRPGIGMPTCATTRSATRTHYWGSLC